MMRMMENAKVLLLLLLLNKTSSPDFFFVPPRTLTGCLSDSGLNLNQNQRDSNTAQSFIKR